MSYIKIFQNAQAFLASVWNNYSNYQRMHIFLNNFRQLGKYSAQKASHQAEFRRKENFIDKRVIYFILIDYPSTYSSCCDENSEKANLVNKKCTFCGGANHSAEKKSKGSERKSNNLVQLMIQTIDVRNAHPVNILDVDLNII